MKIRSAILLGGAKNNCGDFLIVDRARRLFAHFLPEVAVSVLDRTKPFNDSDFERMANADLVVLAGGPLIRGNCAESLHLADAAVDGRLAGMDAPFVIMGGGAKPPEPFMPAQLKMSEPTRRLFEKVESAPFYSGTRDFESLVMLRNAGFGNFGFTGCPALYALPPPESMFRPFSLSNVRKVVFSCGAPGGMCEDAIRQHLDVLASIRKALPQAELVVAFHHAVEEPELQKLFGERSPLGWQELVARVKAAGVRVADVSGGLDRMLALYASADLHVGYRVHAHVLMTSWRKPSLLIAEDGRGSGMADVISGKVLRAWESRRRPRGLAGRIFAKKVELKKVYCGDMGEQVVGELERCLREGKPLNEERPIVKANPMKTWFAQFAERRS